MANQSAVGTNHRKYQPVDCALGKLMESCKATGTNAGEWLSSVVAKYMICASLEQWRIGEYEKWLVSEWSHSDIHPCFWFRLRFCQSLPQLNSTWNQEVQFVARSKYFIRSSLAMNGSERGTKCSFGYMLFFKLDFSGFKEVGEKRKDTNT